MKSRKLHSPLFLTILLLFCSFSNASTENITRQIKFTYDEQGRLKHETVVNGETINYYNYSLHGIAREISIKGRETIVNAIDFDADGSVQKIHYEANRDEVYSSYEKNAFSALKRAQFVNSHFQEHGAIFSGENFQYDSRGNLSSLDRTFQGQTKAHSYTYDHMGKLSTYSLGEDSVTYDYDPQGNLTGKSSSMPEYITSLSQQTYNSKNQREGWQYTEDGLLKADDNYVYQYNKNQRLTLVQDIKTKAWVAHYLYDSAGLRVRKTTPEQVTYYFRNAAGNLSHEEVYSTDKHELIKTIRYIEANGANVASLTKQANGEETLEYQHNDRLLSQAVRWNNKGVVEQQMYSPYGEQMNKSNLHRGAYGFTQHEDDTETNSIYMKARHYSALSGRMNRPDPARDFNIYNPSSFNLYAYVGNNPVNAWDPTGLASAGDPINETSKNEARVRLKAGKIAKLGVEIQGNKAEMYHGVVGELKFNLKTLFKQNVGVRTDGDSHAIEVDVGVADARLKSDKGAVDVSGVRVQLEAQIGQLRVEADLDLSSQNLRSAVRSNPLADPSSDYYNVIGSSTLVFEMIINSFKKPEVTSRSSEISFRAKAQVGINTKNHIDLSRQKEWNVFYHDGFTHMVREDREFKSCASPKCN